jgi:hypothetical protein
MPAGKEHPEYFGQPSIGWSPEDEADRAAEDVSQGLRYAQTVTSALGDALQMARVKSPDLMDPEVYLEHARSLCFLLHDLTGEVERRVHTLSALIDEQTVGQEMSAEPHAGVRDQEGPVADREF